MPKSRRRKFKGPPPPPPPRPPSKPVKQPIGLRAIFGGVVVALGLAFGATVLMPRLQIDPVDKAVAPNGPNLFTLRNTGLVTLTRIEPSMGLCEIDFIDPTSPAGPPDQGPGCHAGQHILSFMDPQAWRRSTLQRDSAFTIALEDLYRHPTTTLGYADIAIVAHYRWWILPYNLTKSVRYTTRPEGDHLIWMEAEPD